MTQPFWFRELLAGGKGPDWMFNATFAPGSSSAADVVREHAPLGFSYYRATQRPCPIHWNSKACDYDLYVDTPHYQACIDQLEGRGERNLYIYHTIQACQHDYQLVRGYGGDSSQHGDAETQAIRALAQAPHLVMTGWNIVYGGGTYSYETLISGATSTTLLTYLEARE
ncbi:MAG: hypothetical protein ABIV47_01745 [Roseiflexaceae bacterium]